MNQLNPPNSLCEAMGGGKERVGGQVSPQFPGFPEISLSLRFIAQFFVQITSLCPVLRIIWFEAHRLADISDRSRSRVSELITSQTLNVPLT